MSRTDVRDRATVAALVGVAFAVFLACPVVQITDHKFLVMASDSLLRRGTLRLDGLTLPSGTLVPGADATAPDYRIEVAKGHYYHLFPVGTAVLSAPAVALGRLVGASAVTTTGAYRPVAEKRLNRFLAAALMAALPIPLFTIARAFLGRGASALLVLAALFGSQVWSTGSRGLWSHDWALLLLAAALAHVVSGVRSIPRPAERRDFRREPPPSRLAALAGRLAAPGTRPSRAAGSGVMAVETVPDPTDDILSRPLRPAWLGSLLAWAYFSRPTLALASIGLLGYLAAAPRTRLEARRAAVVVLAWLGAFVAWSLVTRGQVLPGYYGTGRLAAAGFVTGLAGNLVSPARGTLVFVPWVAWIAWHGVRLRRRLALPGLAGAAALVTLMHLLVVSAFPQWYGGHSYGARMTTELVPWWFLVAVLVLAVWKDEPTRAGSALGAALLLAAVLLNGVGAISESSWRWNSEGDGIDAHPERLWSAGEAQFLAALKRPVVAP